MADDADVIVVGGGTGGPRRRHRNRRRRQARHRGRPGRRTKPRRPGVLVVRRIVSGRQPRTAPARHQGQLRSRAAGLDGIGGLRPRRGSVAAALGGSLCGVRGGRETRLAARDGPSDLPGGRLGRARRLRRDEPRQFGAAVSCHLGHRPRHRRAVRAAGARSAGQRPADVQIPPPRRCAHDHRRHRRRRQRRDPRARQRRARQEQLAQSHRRLHAARAGRDRRLRRHRRQSRSGPAELAEAARRRRRKT